jgi:hypothetical protein
MLKAAGFKLKLIPLVAVDMLTTSADLIQIAGRYINSC